MRQLLLAEMSRRELRDFAPDGILLLPVGATEQHGPHLPAGTDTMTVELMAREAAARLTDSVPIRVAPTLPFGSSHHHLPFGGTLSLTSSVFAQVLMSLGESAARSGFRRLFILNGHGGNQELVEVAARDLALEHGLKVGAGSWWRLASDELAATSAAERGRVPGHSGAFETSIVLAFWPDLVDGPPPHRESTTPKGGLLTYRLEQPDAWTEIDGFSDSPDTGAAEHGRTYVEAAIAGVCRALADFHARTGG